MTFLNEFSELKKIVQSGLMRRAMKQGIAEREVLWPPVLSVAVLVVMLMAVLLLPFDPALSRIAVATQFGPVQIARNFTNLVLATPYIVLFTLVVIVSLIARWRMRGTQAFRLNIPAIVQTYNHLGALIGHSLFGMLAMMSAGLIVNILKFLIGRPRPSLIDSVGPYALSPFNYTYAYVSFPSGHACTAAVLATLVVLWFPRFRIVAYIGLALIASARIAVQAHYPTDVLIGFFIGMLITLILSRFFAQANLLFHLKEGHLFPELALKEKIKI